MNIAKTCKNIIFRKFSTNRKILKLFQKKSSGAKRSSHQLVIDRTSKHFLTQLIIPNNFAEETKSLSSVALKFCEVVPGWNAPKHPETWFFEFSPRIMSLYDFFKKKCSGVTRSSHQLVLNTKVISSSFLTLSLKTSKLYLYPNSKISQKCMKNVEVSQFGWSDITTGEWTQDPQHP